MANNYSAEISDIAYSIALPLGTTEKRGRCTYCKKAGYPYNHEKTAGCRTAIKCNRHTILVVGLNEESKWLKNVQNVKQVKNVVCVW